MGKLTKNKVAYDGAEVTVTMLGISELYAESIEYNTKREHQANYKLGSREPGSYSMGKDEYDGGVEINMIDVVAIQNANKGKKMVDIEPFPIIVSYNPKSIEGSLAPPVVDIVTAKFADQGRDVNGMNLKKKFTLFILSIDENVA